MISLQKAYFMKRAAVYQKVGKFGDMKRMKYMKWVNNRINCNKRL